MAASALKKITTRAKQIRKKHPGKSWMAAVKEAGRQYRGGKIAGVRKKRKPVAKKRKRVSGVKRSAAPRRTAGAVGTISSHKNAAKHLIAEKLGWLDIQIISAKTKTAKNKLLRRRQKYASQARALSV